MAAYDDLGKINSLYTENEAITKAITLIDGGGNLSQFTVVPAPLPPEPPPGGHVFSVPVTISFTNPVSPETMAAVRAQLVTRQGEIATELAALDVTGTPAGAGATGATGATGEAKV